MSVRPRYFCRFLAKFMGSRKKTPAQDIFCENEPPSLLTGEVSQDAQELFCGYLSHSFLQLLRSLSTLNDIDHVANVKKLLAIQAELMYRSILDNHLH